jgi:arabinose-5-phosphate isomerase
MNLETVKSGVSGSQGRAMSSKLDIPEAQRVMQIEAQAIQALVNRLDANFTRAVDLLLSASGKVIFTGMGKSGIIARKIASTLSSTGTPSLFIHPAESSHGDLGTICAGDVVVAISYGGETPELVPLLDYCARKDVPIVAMTGRMTSSLAKAAQVALDVSVKEEACPLGLAPTASTVATLALGDALAMVLLRRRGFSPEEFAEFHPGGSLGRRLLTRVRDVMHFGDALPIVTKSTEMRKVLTHMTAKEVRGVVGVVDGNEQLIGIITDGDIRRCLEKSGNPLSETVENLMSRNPKTIDGSELAEKALFIMEQFSIQTLFVVDRESGNPLRPVGLIHLQDLLRAKIR